MICSLFHAAASVSLCLSHPVEKSHEVKNEFLKVKNNVIRFLWLLMNTDIVYKRALLLVESYAIFNSFDGRILIQLSILRMLRDASMQTLCDDLWTCLLLFVTVRSRRTIENYSPYLSGIIVCCIRPLHGDNAQLSRHHSLVGTAECSRIEILHISTWIVTYRSRSFTLASAKNT